MNLANRINRLIPKGPQRRAVLWLWVAGVALGYAGAHANNTEPFVRATFGLTAGNMSAAAAIARTGSLAAILVTTRSDRTSRKGTFVVAFGLAMSASAMSGFASSIGPYVIAQTLTRLAITASVIIGTVIAVETIEGPGRTYAVSLLGAALSLGAGIATAMLPFADLQAESWRWLFASSLLGLLAVVGIIRGIRDPKSRQTERRTGWYGQLEAKTIFWRMSGASWAMSVFSSVSVAFLVEHLVVSLRTSAAQAALVALTGGTIGGIGFLVGSALANRFGRRRTTYLAIVMSVTGGVAIYQATQIWTVMVFAAVSAFGSFVLVPSFGVLRNELFAPAIRSRAVTWINNAAIVGSIVGLFAGSILIDRIGLPQTVAVLSSGAVLALIMLAGVPEPKPSPVERMRPPAG